MTKKSNDTETDSNTVSSTVAEEKDDRMETNILQDGTQKNSTDVVQKAVDVEADTNTVTTTVSEIKEEKLTYETEETDELHQMLKDLTTPTSLSSNPLESFNQTANKVTTTENLISVLEDECEPDKEKPVVKPAVVEVKDRPKKYLYKLKSKSGRILHYTSKTPVVLKKPIIRLDKMIDNEHVEDSDENNKENEIDSEPIKFVKKKGRPPLSTSTPKSTPLSVSSEDKNSDSDSKRSSSYGIQTRKRQLKFLPDGRLITPKEKFLKSEDGRRFSSSTATSSSESEIEGQSSDEEFSDPTVSKSNKKVDQSFKKSNSFDVKGFDKKLRSKKNIDVESSRIGPKSDITQDKEISKLSNINNKSSDNTTELSSSSKKMLQVDPATLLTSLIGIEISKNQLTTVRFKPKIVQQRVISTHTTPSAVTPISKKVTFEDEKNKSLNLSESNIRSASNNSLKILPKPTYQKILPKPATSTPVPVPSLAAMVTTPKLPKPIAPKPVSEERKITTTQTIYSSSSFKPIKDSVQDLLAKFENFSDTKVVKTKAGPKKLLKRKLDEPNEPRTVYDLLQEVFNLMPSWNLHLIPDSNTFCIAQVSRGRMGIPILKKSIELNSEFFAKVYVHQLHCKRYDGIYDTENKILTLIKEIDALAA